MPAAAGRMGRSGTEAGAWAPSHTGPSWAAGWLRRGVKAFPPGHKGPDRRGVGLSRTCAAEVAARACRRTASWAGSFPSEVAAGASASHGGRPATRTCPGAAEGIFPSDHGRRGGSAGASAEGSGSLCPLFRGPWILPDPFPQGAFSAETCRPCLPGGAPWAVDLGPRGAPCKAASCPGHPFLPEDLPSPRSSSSAAAPHPYPSERHGLCPSQHPYPSERRGLGPYPCPYPLHPCPPSPRLFPFHSCPPYPFPRPRDHGSIGPLLPFPYHL